MLSLTHDVCICCPLAPTLVHEHLRVPIALVSLPQAASHYHHTWRQLSVV